jgi:hypothetical protein
MMFYNTESRVLNGDEVEVAKVMIDLQPYEKTMQFEEDIEIDITARAICDKHSKLLLSHYILVGDTLYKIMKIKEWSDYLECWLYQCEGD